ncbi:MAG: PilZ domain-containing protein [Deltaproteobacteria bacterium]|nr:PilZ domain-containing protein [Deltaproteobacteria bacterium]
MGSRGGEEIVPGDRQEAREACRRRHPRITLPPGTPVTVDGARGQYSAVLRNLSREGAFVETGRIHLIGEILCLRFTLPILAIPLEVIASVRHPRDIPAPAEGIGVGFMDLSADDEERLEACLRLLLDREDPPDQSCSA